MWQVVKDTSLTYTPFPAKFAASLKVCGNMKDSEFRNSFLRLNNFDINQFTCMNQSHSSNVSAVSSAEAGRVFENCDALVTDVRGIVLGVYTADCVPVIVANTKGSVAAVIHAGWRGLEGGIINKTIEVIQNKFGVPPQELTALVGPHIQKCCYKCGDEFQKIFPGSCFDGSCDLDLIAQKQLKDCGLKNISSSERCTCHEEEHFYSFRRDKNENRMLSVVQLL